MGRRYHSFSGYMSTHFCRFCSWLVSWGLLLNGGLSMPLHTVARPSPCTLGMAGGFTIVDRTVVNQY